MTDHTPAHELELYREGDRYEVYAHLPGYEREEVDVRLFDGRLRVRATRRESGEKRTFDREVALPHPIDDDGIAATYDDGVLEVTLPVADAEARPGTAVDVTDEE